MATLVRRCTRCGNQDLKNRWESMDEAAKAGAFREDWACPSCAWPGFEVVEMTRATGRSGGASAGDGDAEHRDPVAPIDPDEARRSSRPVGLPR